MVPPEDKDPIVYHHPTRKSVGYFGAVRLRDGILLYRRETGQFNGESFWNFLKVLQQTSLVAGRRVLVISDNAQYYRSGLHLEWRFWWMAGDDAPDSETGESGRSRTDHANSTNAENLIRR